MLTRTMFGVVVAALLLSAAPAASAATASPTRSAPPASLHVSRAASPRATADRHARVPARRAHARHRARLRAATPHMTAATAGTRTSPRRAPRPATPRQPRRASLPHSRTLSRDSARFRSLPAGVAGDTFTLPGRPDSGWLFRPDPDARIATRCGCVVPARGPPCAEGTMRLPPPCAPAHRPGCRPGRSLPHPFQPTVPRPPAPERDRGGPVAPDPSPAAVRDGTRRRHARRVEGRCGVFQRAPEAR